MRLTVDRVNGIFAIMPTPALENASDWRARETVDLEETARAADALVRGGVDAIMANGTFGEAATLTWEEHRAFAKALVAAVGGRVPVVLGPTTLNTRDTIARGEYFRDLGASGFMLGRPMWVRCDEDTIVSYYTDVAEALPDMGIIVYDNPASFKGKLTPSTYRRLSEIDQVVAAKYTILGAQYTKDQDAVGDRMRLMPIDQDWWYAHQWRPDHATACWSAAASCGPAPCVALREAIASGDDPSARNLSDRIRHAMEPLYPKGDFELFAMYNIGLDKAWIDTAGFMKAGPPRPPYHNVPAEFIEGARLAGRRWRELQEAYSN